MGYPLRERLAEDLRPRGTWRLSAAIKSSLDRQITHLPNRDVSEDETRYPIDAAGMRAFLNTFFVRHLFQLQNSLLDYITSADFSEVARLRSLRILDVGSGPAVASLALLDLAERIRETASDRGGQRWALLDGTIHVLNDMSAICLATGEYMLTEYLRRRENHRFKLSRDRIFTLQTPFPANMPQVRRLASALGSYDLVFLSYVVNPLTETYGLRDFVQAVRTLEALCKPTGRVLIVQDRFQESVLRQIALMLEVECREQTIAQEVYPARGENDTYTYTYHDCLYAPRTGDCVKNVHERITSR